MRLYTKIGDDGETALFDGARVSKTDARVAAYGDIDELNATLGLALATGLDPDLSEVLVQIQRDLFAVGALLADPRARIADRVTKTALGAEDVQRLELAIDRFDDEVPLFDGFSFPAAARARPRSIWRAGSAGERSEASWALAPPMCRPSCSSMSTVCQTSCLHSLGS